MILDQKSSEAANAFGDTASARANELRLVPIQRTNMYDFEPEVNSVLEPKFAFQLQALVDAGRITRGEVSALRGKLRGVNVPPLTDEQIALFLIACDREPVATIATIEEFFKTRQAAPELFDERRLDRDDLRSQLDVGRFAILPQRTPEGQAIVYFGLQDYVYSHYKFDETVTLAFMTLEAAAYDHPPAGIVLLFDIHGMKLMHLTQMKIGTLKKAMHYLQEALPMKLDRVHVLNVQHFIDKIMQLLKPFMKKELFDKICFHLPTDDMSKFHAECVPKHCLPSDFQGDLPSLDELHQLNTKKLEEMRPYFDAEQKQRHEFYAR